MLAVYTKTYNIGSVDMYWVWLLTSIH